MRKRPPTGDSWCLGHRSSSRNTATPSQQQQLCVPFTNINRTFLHCCALHCVEGPSIGYCVLRIYVFELGGAVETLLADTFTSQFQDNCNWSPSCNDIFMNTFVAHRFVHVSIHLLCSTCSYYCLVCEATLNEISWSQFTVVSFLSPMLEKHFYKSFSRKAWRIHIWSHCVSNCESDLEFQWNTNSLLPLLPSIIE